MALIQFIGLFVVGSVLSSGGSLFLLGLSLCYLLMVAEFFIRPLCSMQISSLFMVDGLSVLIVAISFLVGILTLYCSRKDFSLSKVLGKKGVEMGVALVIGFSLFMFFSSSWMVFFVCFEGSLIPMVWIIISWGYQPERMQAGLFIIVYTVCGSMPLLVVLLWLTGISSTDNFLSAKICYSFWNESNVVSVWVVFGLVSGFVVKLPIYLVHGWLPKAHVEAPLAGSMILAGVLLKLGGFGLYRVVWLINLNGGFSGFLLILFLLVVGLIGGCLCNLFCLCQSDLKAIVAYSSVGHIGLCLCGILSGVGVGFAGAGCIMFSHGLCSPILFSLAAALSDWSESRSIILNNGLNSVFPALTFFWALSWFVNIGVPLSLNFIAEWMLISSINFISGWIVPFAWLSCFLSGAAAFYAYGTVCHGIVSLYNRTIGLGVCSRYFGGSSFGISFLLIGSLGFDFFIF